MELKLEQLTVDAGTQPRVAIDDVVVAEYVEDLKSGASFPPVVVFSDGASWWLVDGHHRYHAHRLAGRDKIQVEIHQGTLRDALLFAVGANATHGLRRSNADKRGAVLTMLNNELVATDNEGVPWSDRTVARMCAVSHEFVRKLRAESTGSLSTVDSEPLPEPPSPIAADGDLPVLDAEHESVEPNEIPVASDPEPKRRAYTRRGTKAVMSTEKIGKGRLVREKQKRRLTRCVQELYRAYCHMEQPDSDQMLGKSLLQTFGVGPIKNLVIAIAAHIDPSSEDHQ